MKSDVLTVEQQRARRIALAMASIGLEAKLRLLINQIISGDASKVSDFHYWLRFAPPEMNERLLASLDQRQSAETAT